jgi:peptidase C13-like protein
VILRSLRLPFRAATLRWAAVAASLLLFDIAGAQEPLKQGQERGPDGGQEQASLHADSVSRRQPLLLEQALAGLEGARADQPPRLFFVGFAGYGWEAVFKREALAVRALFDERFGTKGRSLVLINHPTTVDGIALASSANLDRVLQHIGGLMNRDADTLFLFLTSHGREDLFAVEMPGFEFGGLTPAELKAMLDRSQIKNRVVVVSACHSGSFIPALAGPTTLVIAAARADRTSFGCEDRREWTYFGDAFFNRALRQERSFERAFQLASRTIGRWEARERLTRSLPQIAGGEALRQRLDELARGAK